MTGRVIVIGAGIIGATSALALARAGWSVTLCEAAHPGSEDAASYGNGGWISPASIIPMSVPGLWRQVPGLLLDPEGALTIDWKSLPRLTPWLLRFLLSGATKARVARTARILNGLLQDAPTRHLALARETRQQHLIERKGLLYAYPDWAAFEKEAFSWSLRRDNGVAFDEWDEQQLRTRLPALSSDYKFAAHVTGGAHCRDTGTYVAGIVDAAVRAGVRYVGKSVRAISDSATPKLELEGGDTLEADYIVVAAGIGSKKLMWGLGVRVPLESERGYHVTISSLETPFDIPVMPSTGKMANTPTNMGLRISGQVELAYAEKAPNWKRAEVLRRHALASYPYLNDDPNPAFRLWMGHRPSTPDGLPLIGPFTRHPRIIAAFGHGHIGIASAPKTAELVVDAVNGRVTTQSIEFLPTRFGH